MELEFQMSRKGHLLNIEPGFQTGTEGQHSQYRIWWVSRLEVKSKMVPLDYKDTIRLYGNVTFRLYDTNLNIAEIT